MEITRSNIKWIYPLTVKIKGTEYTYYRISVKGKYMTSFRKLKDAESHLLKYAEQNNIPREHLMK
jgi:hypothetical protein